MKKRDGASIKDNEQKCVGKARDAISNVSEDSIGHHKVIYDRISKGSFSKR